MTNKQDFCCVPAKKEEKGILKGVLYSLLPHTFCIAFILFSLIGSVAATAIFKKILIIPYFFTFLVAASVLFATLSAFIYLKKTNCLCLSGIKRKWKYLATLYSTMIFINLAMFAFVFPALANINSGNTLNGAEYSANLSIAVDIPCSGHASLIVDELKKNNYIGQVKFLMPNIFNINYDSTKISAENILSMDIFNTYKATRN